MTTLIFVRHGESEANLSQIFAGHYDVGLTDKGHKQARLVAQYLQEKYCIDKIYASDLLRTMQTAAPTADMLGLDIIRCNDLREIFAGEWQGLRYADIQSTYPLEYDVWLRDIGRAMPVGGESVKALSDRIWYAVQRIARQSADQTAVIVTHATPIRTLICRLTGRSIDDLKDVSWGENAAITVVAVDQGEWKLIQTNVTEHLAGAQSAFPPNI